MFGQQSKLINEIGQTERGMVGTTGAVNDAYKQKLNFLNGQLNTLKQQDKQQNILTKQQRDNLDTLKQKQDLETNITNAKHEQSGIIEKNTSSLAQQIKMQFRQYAIYYAVSSIIQGIVGSISNCVNYTKDLNEVMTNIRIVTMDTKEATDALLDNYNQMGQKLGANTLDIAEGAVDWLRQGYSEGDTAQLVEGSVVLSKLALIDSAQATEYLTSALKGYKLEASDVVGVIDQLVAIDLEAATSAGDMAEAMSRTANMARTTGIEMNELLGMIATTAEVTQNSASVVGNSIKTVLSRMSNIASGKEIDDAGESLNDVEQTLNRIGVSLRDGGNWRDFYDVLDEIAGKWDTLNDLEKSQATTALGGKQSRVPQHIVIYGVAV